MASDSQALEIGTIIEISKRFLSRNSYIYIYIYVFFILFLIVSLYMFSYILYIIFVIIRRYLIEERN